MLAVFILHLSNVISLKAVETSEGEFTVITRNYVIKRANRVYIVNPLRQTFYSRVEIRNESFHNRSI